jgi:creatinine amidohydrolase
MMAAVADTYGFGLPDGLFGAEEREHGIHGGAIETSLMLHLEPEASAPSGSPNSTGVDRARRRGSALRYHGRGALAWATQDLHPSGACGDARLASAEAGAAILAHAAAGLAALLDAVAAHPLDSLRDGPVRATRSAERTGT